MIHILTSSAIFLLLSINLFFNKFIFNLYHSLVSITEVPAFFDRFHVWRVSRSLTLRIISYKNIFSKTCSSTGVGELVSL